MKAIASTLALALGVTLTGVPDAAAVVVTGGGRAQTDCYVGFEVEGANTDPLTVNGVRVSQKACGGTCAFQVQVCANEPVAGCEPAPVTSNKVRPRRFESVLDASVTGSDHACGTTGTITVGLRRRGNRPGRTKISVITKADASSRRLRKDVNKLLLECLPNPNEEGCVESDCGNGTVEPGEECDPGATPSGCGGSLTCRSCFCSPCPDNPAGGPSDLHLNVIAGGIGGDLDNGHLGISHNFPLTGSSLLDFCLADCGGSDTDCTGTGATGPNTLNGPTFGAPLPLFAAGVPVCVVNRFNGPIVARSANYATGEFDGSVPLLADVYITNTNSVCPQCSGSAVGQTGVCQGGRNNGRACTVHGTAFVSDHPGADKTFELSADCPPAGTPLGPLDIALDPLTTATASITGPRPCQNQTTDDPCGGGTCTGPCSGDACVEMVPDPTNPGSMICKARKGGLSQVCCSNRPDTSCYPTRGGGTLSRTGLPSVPEPDVPGEPFPASTSPILVSVFCEGATGDFSIDGATAGLPAPGALIQPMTGKYLP